MADIELGEPQQEEPAATATTDASTSNDAKMEETPSATVANGNGKGESESSNAKRTSQQDTTDNHKSLPPSKRTRTAPGGAQRRLFGVLTKTLSKFQEETKKDTQAVGSSKACLRGIQLPQAG